MIELDSVSVDYGTASPLRDLSIEFTHGTNVVMGPSGSGKSTLLRVIAGAQRATSGRVVIDGTPITTANWRSAGEARVAMIHQDYRLITFLSVEENVRLAAELRGIDLSAAQVSEAMAGVNLEGMERSRPAGSLSGGEQQRLAIARALLCGADVLLADEPTGALDEANTRQVADLLYSLARSRGVMIVIATHDPDVAAQAEAAHLLNAGALARARS